MKNGPHNLQGNRVASTKAEVEVEDDDIEFYMGDDEENLDEEMYSMKFLGTKASSKRIATHKRPQ